MRKEKLITRTITVSTAQFMCLDTETANVEIATAELIGKVDNETALKMYKATVETDTFKVVSCQSVNYTEQLYGMTEKEFIKHAKILPPRSKTAETEEKESAEE